MKKAKQTATPSGKNGDPLLIERPDGFYWQDPDTGKMFGPFATLLAALEDVEYQADSDYEEGESLAEAEDEIGILGWVDPDTGDLAEGVAPRLNDD
ncbi:MAG: hypothetical protein LBE50_05265 [Gallionellaceae bacterium]|nr:hypothetical protein [Gallionellaceae bacterium]